MHTSLQSCIQSHINHTKYVSHNKASPDKVAMPNQPTASEVHCSVLAACTQITRNAMQHLRQKG